MPSKKVANRPYCLPSIAFLKRNGKSYMGYITVMYPEKEKANITILDRQILKGYGINRCQLIWRFNKIYWI